MPDTPVLRIEHADSQYYETLQLKDDHGFLVIAIDNGEQTCAIILDEDEIDDLYEALTRFRQREQTQESRALELLYERFGFLSRHEFNIRDWWRGS